MRYKWMMVLFFILSSLAVGQTQIKVSHHLRYANAPILVKSVLSNPVDTVRMLAIMVEFQADNDDQTTGDGKFQMTGSQAQIDPPPHDSAYFSNKIRFVKNYFRKVSNGKLTINGELLGQRIVLAKPMSSYAPPTTITDNRKLAELANVSWKAADSIYSGIDFSRYDLFVIFHAGAGRDIEFISSLGFNPTPFDIPSLYLDSTAFAAALVQPAFNGFVNGYVKNTIILPETESRDIEDYNLQLSINGLFAASVGSYLGLPDLFDTKTGRSGIGQFGLMDGAGIFAYNGLFPPEPNAWEKKYLGWVTPIAIRNSTPSIVLPAVGLSDAADTVYQITINNSEYFLIENRNRNPHGTGLYLTIASSNGDSIVHFKRDTAGFKYYDTDSIRGSIVDVSNFDWALIGEMLDTTDLYDGGGILIWHIDENIIQTGRVTNTINADIEHRGVELKEADGSKDIGQNYEQLTSGYGTEYGSPLDCWFSDNPAPLYGNSFDGNSFPNSNSHSGAASLVTIKDFSPRSERMSVSVEIGSNVLQRDPVFSYSLANASSYPTSTKEHLYFPASDGIYAFKNDGTGLMINSSPVLSTTASDYGIAAYKLSDNMEIAVSVKDSTLSIFDISLSGDPVFIRNAVFRNKLTTSPCITNIDSLRILVGAGSGSFYILDISGRLVSERSVGGNAVSSIAFLPKLTNSCEYFFTAGNHIYSAQDSVELPVSSNEWILAAAVSPEGSYIAALEKNGSKVVSFNQSLSNMNFEIDVKGSAIREAAIADIDGNGEKDLIVQSISRLSVFNRIGSLLDGFPISVKSGLEFTGTPLIVDFNGDDKPEIILLTNDGEMWVYGGNGKLLSGFPVQVVSPGNAFPVIYASPYPSNKLGIAIFSENGTLNAFLSDVSVSGKTLYWWQHLGDEKHLNADTSATLVKQPNTEFLPKSRVYNWPNPVYGRSTHIRYYTSENANITITILDLAGVKITELKGRGIAGMDNEILWDVSNIQSGVYLARIEAQGATQNCVTIIKIAVVK